MNRTATARWIALGLASLLALSVPGAALAAPSGATVVLPVGSTSWAYGGFRSVNVSGSGTDANGSYEYSIQAYFGVEVVLAQQNLSGGDTQLTIQRTEAANFYADYCRPNCATPLITANISYKAVEIGTGEANLTAGVVWDAGTSLPATALASTYTTVDANISEVAHTGFHGILGTKSATSEFFAQANASVGVTLAPALGLYPTNRSVGESWNSTSTYVASGGWSLAFTWLKDPLIGLASSGHGGGSGSADGNGTVALAGSDAGPITLADGTTVDAVALVTVGPFTVREGLLFLPATADLFGPTDQRTFSGVASGGQSAGTSAIDLGGADPGHVALESSSSTFASDASPAELPSSSSSPMVAPFALAADTPASDSTGPVTVQAQPQSVGDASTWTACLQTSSCPIPAAGSTARGGLIVAIAVLGIAVLLVGLVAARRRTPPAPPRANARLYPPLGAPIAPTPGARPGTPPPPPDPDPADPLNHLW